MEYLTTAQKRKARAEAEYAASLGPKGQSRGPAPLRRASAAQTLLMYGGKNARLHRPGCFVIDALGTRNSNWVARLATNEELATHGGCGHCA